jgi:branched-chain amino acid transport system ATP-binding protein
MNTDVILETKALTMRFGGLTAAQNFSAALPVGSITGLIGPNGAGKTTCFNMITGFYKPTSGKTFYRGQDLTGMPPHLVCKAGVARTFQNIRLFSNETVLENVLIGGHLRQKTSWLQAVFFTPGYLKEDKEMRARALELLDVVGLKDLAGEQARSLPYGAQRRLEIARAMATDPFLLLLDEPAAGMNPRETDELEELIVRIRNEAKISILMIEHDMRFVMGLCERIAVLNFGRIIAEGTPEQIKKNPDVIEAYLGRDDDQAAV